MYKRIFGLFLALACQLSLVSPTVAQEGHPMVGTWQGDWGTDANNSNFLTIILNWDGTTLSGLVNPGPDSSAVGTAVMDSSNWSVHLETELKDGAGKSAHFVIDGTLENIGSHMRTLSGTWQYEGKKGNFTLNRQGGA